MDSGDILTSSLLGEQSSAISKSVCLSVCLHNLKNHKSKIHDIFCTCYLWPWLSPPLTTKQYVVYFLFCGWRHVFTWWGIRHLTIGRMHNGTYTLFIMFGRVRHGCTGGWSLMSMIAKFSSAISKWGSASMISRVWLTPGMAFGHRRIFCIQPPSKSRGNWLTQFFVADSP